MGSPPDPLPPLTAKNIAAPMTMIVTTTQIHGITFSSPAGIVVVVSFSLVVVVSRAVEVVVEVVVITVVVTVAVVVGHGVHGPPQSIPSSP